MRIVQLKDISGGSLTSSDILATTGAAGALFIIATAILRKGYVINSHFNGSNDT